MWIPTCRLNEELDKIREENNPHDCFAVAAKFVENCHWCTLLVFKTKEHCKLIS